MMMMMMMMLMMMMIIIILPRFNAILLHESFGNDVDPDL